MPRKGATGLTIRDSTYSYVSERKEGHTWNDIIKAGMDDIEDQDVVSNGVTITDSDTSSSHTISVGEDIYHEIKARKKDFRLNVTWDDIAVHGAQRISGENTGGDDGLSEEEKAEIRAIVDERINERFDDLEALGRATGQFTSPPQKSYGQEEGETTVLTTERPYKSARRRYRPDQQEFRQALLEAYGSQCAVCNWECRSLETENPLVEAPHIRPVEEGGTSNVSNGILLCPNCHQLFDNGVFSLTDDYRMIINPDADAITKAEVKSYEGRQIHLPSDVSDRPAEEQLQWHRENHNIEPPDEFQN